MLSSFFANAAWPPFHVCKTAMWVQRTRETLSKTTHVIGMQTVIRLFNWLINETHINNGSIIKKQIKGTPMGTNCGPPGANLYLYTYESGFIDQMTPQ